VSTIVIGQAASAAAVLVLAGTRGKRYALPHSRILLHQPHGGAEGQAVDIEIQAKGITRYRKLLEQLIAMHTGQPLEKVAFFAARRDNTLIPIDTDTARVSSTSCRATHGIPTRWEPGGVQEQSC
jgi:ATP-dependent Clp endopeptidase proteolytic subunit ClpP